MSIFAGMSELEIAEAYADELGHEYCDEQAVSDLFDTDMVPHILEHHGVKGEEFSDEAMISEAFNNWTDALCRDGYLARAQLNSYCYVGRWS